MFYRLIMGWSVILKEAITFIMFFVFFRSLRVFVYEHCHTYTHGTHDIYAHGVRLKIASTNEQA